jgi:CO/xanthine dehydrogenase Mo-binding subunit
MTAIAAEILNAPFERVRYMSVNTDSSPFDQGTNASSGIAVMGRAVAMAAQSVRDQVMAFAAEHLDCRAEDLVLEDWTVRRGNETFPLNRMIMRTYGGSGFEFTGEGYLKAEEDHSAPLETKCAAWEYGWGAAEVEVDTETGRIDLNRLVISGDAGRAINELVCRGQDEGSAVMGLGGALFETILHDGPYPMNAEALTYRLPLATDIPDGFESILQEQGHGAGPFGSKGVGEGGILPVASAIANAIEDAIGVRVTQLPLTPERVCRAIDTAEGRAGYEALFRGPDEPEIPVQ